MANDASISGLTVGKGTGAVASNTAVGASALANSTGGSYGLNAFGYQSLIANTSGNSNNAFGSQALASNTTGSSLVAIGHEALKSNTTASYQTAIGYQAGIYSTGGFNTLIGAGAGQGSSGLTTGSGNTAVGFNALVANRAGSDNVAIGVNASSSNTTGNYNVAVGREALLSNTTASNNTAVGYQALYSNTTAVDNTAVGYGAGYSNTTGSYNTAYGAFSFYSNTTGTNNCAFGQGSLDVNTTGSANVAMGRNALGSSTTASDNTVLGYQAGFSTTTGGSNTYVGSSAGYVNTTGTYNVCIGQSTGINTDGSSNTFLGAEAGYYVSSGTKNTIIGRYTGNQGGLDIRTASNYIVLSDGDGNPRFRMDNNGYPFFSNMPAGAGTYPLKYNTTTGAVTADTSSRLYKSNIESSPYGLNEVLKLQSRKYKRIDDGSVEIGLIADEVYEVMPEFVPMISKSFVTGNVEDTEIIAGGVNYDKLTSVLVKAIQELKAEVDSLKQQLGK
jgi:hypothetical protein